jgi:hypothetical protein
MRYIALCIFFFMTACTSTPPIPQTPRQSLLAGYELLSTYVDAIKQAEASKLITADEKTQLLARANDAYAFLEEARLFLAGTPSSELLCANTMSCLQLAQKVLTDIQTHIPQEKTP